MSPFSSILQNRLQRYYKFFKYTRFLAKKYRLCSHKRSFLLKRLLFARKCERTFEGVPIYMGEEVEGTIYRKNNLSLAYAPHNATVPSEGTRLRGVPKVLSASFPRSLQQVPKGAQRMMKGCSKVAYAFVG